MTRFYLNGKEADKKEFEKHFGHEDVNWRIETMDLNGVKEFTNEGPYNRICKIVID